jgi:hypothetical protein
MFVRLDDDIHTLLLEEITKNIPTRASMNETEVLYDCGELLGAAVAQQ